MSQHINGAEEVSRCSRHQLFLHVQSEICSLIEEIMMQCTVLSKVEFSEICLRNWHRCCRTLPVKSTSLLRTAAFLWLRDDVHTLYVIFRTSWNFQQLLCMKLLKCALLLGWMVWCISGSIILTIQLKFRSCRFPAGGVYQNWNPVGPRECCDLWIFLFLSCFLKCSGGVDFIHIQSDC